MTNDEAKAAWKSGVPVIHRGIEYVEVSALIYRIDRQTGKMSMQVELYDRCGHAVVITDPKLVEVKAGGSDA